MVMTEATVERCAIGLGGNLGVVPATFRSVTALFAAHPQMSSVRCSPFYRSAAMGAAAGDLFWNAVLLCQTSLPADELLTLLQTWETTHARTRTVRWGPRTLDLDLLVYGDLIQSTPRLTLPHPGLCYRRFVLDPWCDLDPHGVDPMTGCSFSSLRNRLASGPPTLWLPTDLDQSRFAQLATALHEKRPALQLQRREPNAIPDHGIVLIGPQDHTPTSLPTLMMPEGDPTIIVQTLIDIATAAWDAPQRLNPEV
jgi:2-amino-4-hydroxy-6-hydroxymethyldihydropteridine diphosphokinase